MIIFALLLAYFVLAASSEEKKNGSSNFFSKIGHGIKQFISFVKKLVRLLAGDYIGSIECSLAEKFPGVFSNLIDKDDEPDLKNLTLEYNDKFVCITYNITNVTRESPLVRSYNPKQNLIIFVHGFTVDPSKPSFQVINRALMEEGKVNVFALDCSYLLKWFYLRSTTYIPYIGEKLGEVLAAMVDFGVNHSRIHLIGHSLGAHICGFAGKTFRNLTSKDIGRITGLDPAGPCYSDVDDNLRLKATDATFVDIIHTNSDGYGLKDPIGDVDFYPNNGRKQPSCHTTLCSHKRAFLYFAESVTRPDAFPGVMCNDWDAFKKGKCRNQTSYMGYPCEPGTKGIYYLKTGKHSPYGLGSKGLVYQSKT